MKNLVLSILGLTFLGAMPLVAYAGDEVNVQTSDVVVTQDGNGNIGAVTTEQTIRSTTRSRSREQMTNSAGNVQDYRVDVYQRGMGNETRVRGRQSVERNINYRR